MDRKEQTKFGADQRPETEEKKEAPVVQESPEVIRDRMQAQAATEVANFQKEGNQRLEAAENRVAAEGLTIDSSDEDALQGLNGEAEHVRQELVLNISDRSPQTPPPFTPENINAPQHVIDTYFPTSPPPPPLPKEFSDVPPPPFAQKNITPPPLPKEYQARQQPNSQEQTSAMKAREVESAEALTAREASKKFLAEERQKLAEQIRAERKMQRERLLSLKTTIETEISSPESADGLQEDGKFGKIFEMQSAEANELSTRINSSELSAQEAQEERENISNLISNSEGIRQLKAKLEEHYAKADELSRGQFETTRKTVEQTLLRNNAFIVHTFLTDERQRHNDNSNISGRATLEDDMNLLLSLEPSISTSSVVPGCKHGLWNERIGVVLGGGEIKGANFGDAGTRTGGIKERFGASIKNSQEIDELVSDKQERSYNELVIDNPKVFGFFQSVNINESGQMIGFKISELTQAEDIKQMKDTFLNYMELGTEKEMPALIMTPDRRLFEFVSIDDNGIVAFGSEITPEQVAKGRAGLPEEKRREIGEEIIAKNLFNRITDLQEAKGIVAEFSGEERAGVELTREEYASYAKDNPGKIRDFPKHLLADKPFMMEIAQYDPVSTYDRADENLKRDIDFIKHIYSLEKTGIKSSIYEKIPEELKQDEAIAALAIENNDFEKLDATLADSPSIWEKLVDKFVGIRNPEVLFAAREGIEEGNVGARRILMPGLMMSTSGRAIDMSKRLVSDENFVRKLNERYPNYKFEVDPRQHIVVTKLA